MQTLAGDCCQKKFFSFNVLLCKLNVLVIQCACVVDSF